MKKIKSKYTLFIVFSVAISAVLYFANRNPEYIKITEHNVLSKDKLRITEIAINSFAGKTFGSREIQDFLKDKDGTAFFPTNDSELITQIINYIKEADKTCDLSYPENALFFKTGNPIIGYKYYYLEIDWDDEKVYGKGWQSKELYELIKQWRQEKEDLYYQAREN